MHLFSHSYSALPCDGFLHAVSVRVVGNDDLPGVTRYALHHGLKRCAHSGRVFLGNRCAPGLRATRYTTGCDMARRQRACQRVSEFLFFLS